MTFVSPSRVSMLIRLLGLCKNRLKARLILDLALPPALIFLVAELPPRWDGVGVLSRELEAAVVVECFAIDMDELRPSSSLWDEDDPVER